MDTLKSSVRSSAIKVICWLGLAVTSISGNAGELLGTLQVDGRVRVSGEGTTAGTSPGGDAMVCFCAAIPHENVEPEYKTVALAVADVEGRFKFLLEPALLDNNTIYAVRARVAGSGWMTRPLGDGASLKGRTDPFNVTLEVQHERDTLRAGQFVPATFGSLEVLFATDRALSHKSTQLAVLNENNPTGRLTFGHCEVAVERNRIDDNLLHYFADRDSGRYYTIQSVNELTPLSFWASFSRGLDDSSGDDALLFVHGYNTSFQDACRRAAQVAYDLKFRGPVLLYSWPSHASLRRYAADEEMAEWSSPHFAEFLKSILEGPHLKHLHIVAHSMGNRVVLRGLFSPRLTRTDQQHLGEIIFAAPDVNRLIFDESDFSGLASKRITMYASSHDQALAASKLFHGYGRAGDATPEIDVRPGLDSVDASSVDSSLLGHNYIGEARSVLADLAALLSADAPPERRFGLLRKSSGAKTWWVISP